MHLQLRAFKAKVNIRIERDRFIIKTAESHEELAGALKLRYDVFYKELLEKRLIRGIDIDKFDFKCDHLIIIDKKTNAFIGTYRLISTDFSKKFYSESEFTIDNIVNLPGTKLELGRACVHKDFRTGSTIALLWRGISEYMKLTGTKYLFGCSSVMTTDKNEIAMIYHYLQKTNFAPEEYRVYPRGKYRIKNFSSYIDKISEEKANSREISTLVPPLIKSYLNMGAMICGEPALDKKFRCADFLTLFNIDNSSDKVHRKYQL
jgi:putative hemolysin